MPLHTEHRNVSPVRPGTLTDPPALRHFTRATDTWCWCEPEVREVCPTCSSGEPAHEDRASCWHCDGEGTIPCDAPDAYMGAKPLIIIHRAR